MARTTEMASPSASSSTWAACVHKYRRQSLKEIAYLGAGTQSKLWMVQVLLGDASLGAGDTPLAAPTPATAATAMTAVAAATLGAVTGASAEDKKLAAAANKLRVIKQMFLDGAIRHNFTAARARAVRVNALPNSYLYFMQLVGEAPDEKMPFLLYESLDDHLRVPVAAELYVRWQVLSNVAEALSILHQHGLAHGDIKPNNIWLRSTPMLRPAPASPLRVKVADFGVVRGPSTGRGTAADPDFRRDQCTDSKTGDVVALGLLAYEVLSGFSGTVYSEYQDEMIEGHLDDVARNAHAYVKWWADLAPNVKRLLRLCSLAHQPKVLAELLAWQTELEKSLPPCPSSSSSSSLSPTGSDVTPSDAEAAAVATGAASFAGLFTIIRRAFDHWTSLAAPTPTLVASVRIRLPSLVPRSLTLSLSRSRMQQSSCRSWIENTRQHRHQQAMPPRLPLPHPCLCAWQRRHRLRQLCWHRQLRPLRRRQRR